MLRVALLQTNPRPGAFGDNLARATTQLHEAADSGAHLAVLPEMWCRAFSDPQDDKLQHQAVEALETWRQTCRAAGIAAAGSLPEYDAGTWYNTCYMLDEHGRILTAYRKLHLFSPLGEHRRYGAGDVPVTVQWQGLRWGLTVCYDLRFPELYRALRAEGADIFLTVAQWPSARHAHWDLLLRARAVENLCAHIGVNRTGAVTRDDHTLHYDGGSAVISPWGEPYWVGGAAPMIGQVHLDPATLREQRTFPSWQDRRFDVGLGSRRW